MEQSPKQSPAPVVEQAMKPCEACNGTRQFQGIFSSDPNWPPCPRCSSLLRMPDDPAWYMKKAALEGGHEISAGSPVVPAAAVEPVADLIERLTKLVDFFVGDYGYNQAQTCKEAAASLSQLSTKLENAERERDHFKQQLAVTFDDQCRYLDRAIAAEQERDELRAKLAEALETIDDEIAAYSDPRLDCPTNRAVLIALNHIRARAVKGAGQS